MGMGVFVNFAIVFQLEGLDKDGIRKDLASMVKIVDESDGSIMDRNGNEVPLWCFVCTGTLSKYLKVKMEYNCYSENYILYPREPGEFRSIFAN